MIRHGSAEFYICCTRTVVGKTCRQVQPKVSENLYPMAELILVCMELLIITSQLNMTCSQSSMSQHENSSYKRLSFAIYKCIADFRWKEYHRWYRWDDPCTLLCRVNYVTTRHRGVISVMGVTGRHRPPAMEAIISNSRRRPRGAKGGG